MALEVHTRDGVQRRRVHAAAQPRDDTLMAVLDMGALQMARSIEQHVRHVVGRIACRRVLHNAPVARVVDERSSPLCKLELRRVATATAAYLTAAPLPAAAAVATGITAVAAAIAVAAAAAAA